MLRKVLSYSPMITLVLTVCLLPPVAFTQVGACSATDPNAKNSAANIPDAACANTGVTKHVGRAGLKPNTGGFNRLQVRANDAFSGLTGFTVLHVFQGVEGIQPQSPPVQDTAGNLYTTALGGSLNGYGAIYEVTSPTAGALVYAFGGATGTNDGAFPYSSLLLDSSGNLWGTTNAGSASCTVDTGGGGCDTALGTVFKFNPSSGAEAVVASFAGAPTANRPTGGLVQDAAGNFYGVTQYGGTHDQGTVFKMDSLGNVVTLYSFTSGTDGSRPGAYRSNESLVMDSSGNLYGTTAAGGAYGQGTVFKITNPVTSPTYSLFHSFGAAPGYSNMPVGTLTMDSAGNFYGVTEDGGNYSYGNVYKLNSAGTTETDLYDFQGGTDGGYPVGQVAVDGAGNVFGSTTFGGAHGVGGIYTVTPMGTETVLYSFNTSTDGSGANGLILSPDGNLFGTSFQGASTTFGTVWGYRVYNPLSVTISGAGIGTVTSSPAGITPLNCTTGTCSVMYTPGTAVTLTENPQTGSTFGGWGGACASSGTNPTCSITMSSPQSVTATFNTGNPPTTTTLTSSSNPSSFRQTVSFKATVASSSGTPTGTVTFSDGATTLGTGTLSTVSGAQVATYSTASLTVATHQISAVYTGDSTHKGSTSNTVNQVVNKATTTIAVTSNLNPSTYGQSVTFTATIAANSGFGGCTGIVTFYDGSNPIDPGEEVLSNMATLTLSTLSAGSSQAITAVYGGDSNCNGSTSPALNQTVRVDGHTLRCVECNG